MIDRLGLLNTLIELLKIDSPSRYERPVADYLIKYFKNIGLDIKEDDTAGKIDGNAGNLYLRIDGDYSSSSIAFLAHMDTVGPTKGLEPIISDTHIHSNRDTILGADNCAGIALICELVRFLKKSEIKHCPLEVIFTVSEEIGLLGIKNIDYNNIKSKMAFVLDAGGPAGTIVTKAPSLERIYVTVIGKSAHAGAEPENGINAIAIAARAINSIKQGRIDSETTLNIGTIQGGTATNIVPDKVIIEGEARSFKSEILTEQVKNLEDKFHSAAKEFSGSIEFNHRLSFSAFNLDKNTQPVRLAISAAEKSGIKYDITYTGGGSDANILNTHGITSVGLGVGVFDAHTNRENVVLEDFYKSLEWLIEIVRR